MLISFFKQTFHFLLIFIIIKFLNLGLNSALFALIGGIILDVDVIQHFKKIGIKGYIYVRRTIERRQARKYLFHNIFSILFSFIGAMLILNNLTFNIGIFFFSAFLHLISDFFIDLIFLKNAFRNWTTH